MQPHKLRELHARALRVADAMATDATTAQHNLGHAATADGASAATVAHADAVVVVRRVRSVVAVMMRECFAFDANQTASAVATRPTSTDCERRLIALWDEVFARQRWRTHRAALPKPRESPFAKAFSAVERRGMHFRLVLCGLVRLMLRRCDAILRTAQAKHADTTVLACLRDRVRPHKYRLQQDLVASLQLALRCFESALRTAQTPACVQCGRQRARSSDRGSEDESKPRDAKVGVDVGVYGHTVCLCACMYRCLCL